MSQNNVISDLQTSDMQTMEALLDDYLSFGVPKAGDVREGHVVSCHPSSVLVDIGAKSEGVISSDELDKLDKEQFKQLAVGEEVRVYIVNPEDAAGNIIVSYLKVAEEEDWKKAVDLKESAEPTECTVIGHNRGGLLTRIGSLRGFIPASQLGHSHQIRRNNPADGQLRLLVGKTLTIKVLEADKERGKLILSELAAEHEVRASQRSERIATISKDDVFEGKVINVTDFGAFVDIGGIEGLVHLSELSWKHFSKPSDVVSVGDTVKVSVLTVDEKNQRINLSIKQISNNPWQNVVDLYPLNALAEVTVTQLTRYGAFARINDDYRLEGLIHISELSNDHIKSPDEVVAKGQNITVRIIRIDPDQKQIGFSLKQVFSEKFMALDIAMSQAKEAESEAEPAESEVEAAVNESELAMSESIEE